MLAKTGKRWKAEDSKYSDAPGTYSVGQSKYCFRRCVRDTQPISGWGENCTSVEPKHQFLKHAARRCRTCRVCASKPKPNSLNCAPKRPQAALWIPQILFKASQAETAVDL